MGIAAVEALLTGKREVMVGIINNEVVLTSFHKAVKHNQEIDLNIMRMVEILSA
jgi:6-phosphofructokinase 1